jgi:hypothetical protein
MSCEATQTSSRQKGISATTADFEQVEEARLGSWADQVVWGCSRRCSNWWPCNFAPPFSGREAEFYLQDPINIDFSRCGRYKRYKPYKRYKHTLTAATATHA